jgi:hypothetical protein
MPGNPHIRFDEGRVGRHLGARPLSYSTVSAVKKIFGCGYAALRLCGRPRLRSRLALCGSAQHRPETGHPDPDASPRVIDSQAVALWRVRCTTGSRSSCQR